MSIISSFYGLFVGITLILALTVLFKLLGFRHTRWYHYLGIVAISMVPIFNVLIILGSVFVLVLYEKSNRK